MAEDPTTHNKHAASLAYLNDTGKVSNFSMEQKEHVSQNPSDLQQISEAQVVTQNKVSFIPDETQPSELQSGPPKKYIDNPDANANTAETTQTHTATATTVINNAVPLSNFAHAAMDQSGQTAPQQNNVDSFVPATDANDKQTYESFFADDSGNAPKSQTQTQNASEDIFGGMGMGNEQKQEQSNEQSNNDMFGDAMDTMNENAAETEEKKEEKQTFLSVWQEQHREQLATQGKAEREQQQQMLEKAKEELDKFNETRRARIEQQRKDAKAREADLREDYNYVYKHGTIWQQVAKLVDLKQKDKQKETERMRDLLIILKNQDERKSDQ